MPASLLPASGDAESVADAVDSGDRRRVLEALARTLADSIERADAMTVSPIAGRLAAIQRELDELPNAEESSTSDQLAEQRARRRAGAARAAPATGTDQ